MVECCTIVRRNMFSFEGRRSFQGFDRRDWCPKQTRSPGVGWQQSWQHVQPRVRHPTEIFPSMATPAWNDGANPRFAAVVPSLVADLELLRPPPSSSTALHRRRVLDCDTTTGYWKKVSLELMSWRVLVMDREKQAHERQIRKEQEGRQYVDS